MRGRKIDRVVIDEASFITEEEFKKLRKSMKPTILDRVINLIRKILRIKTKNYWVGVDFAKGKTTTSYGHFTKGGKFIIDKIVQD